MPTNSDYSHLKYLSLLIAVSLHLVLFLLFARVERRQLISIKAGDLLTRNQIKEKWRELELVEIPESARSSKPPPKAELLSDKNSIARDQYLKHDKPVGDPYSEGDANVKNLLPAGNPPVPPVTNKGSTMRSGVGASPEQSNKFLAERYVFKKFSREQLLKGSSSSHLTQNQSGVNRPSYRNVNSHAENFGGLSFNTYNWDFAPYMLEMKRKVERNVFPPPAFTYMGLISGETLLKFRVLLNGEVTDLVVIKYTGHESLKETSVKAILNSSPFKPLPADFPENYLEVTASFTYYVKR